MIGHKKKMKFVKEKKKSLLALIVLLGLLCIPPVMMASFVLAFNLDEHKERIAELLSTQLDRKIQILGPVSWHFSRNGRLGIDMQDVAVGNPSWASRPLMAHAARVQLVLDMESFLEKKLDIVGTKFFATDMAFEMNAQRQENWEFELQDKKEEFEPFFVFQSDLEKERQAKAFFPIEFHIEKIEFIRSRVAVKTPAGSFALSSVPYLSFDQKEEGAPLRLHYRSQLDGLPFEMDVAGASFEDISKKVWPFNLKAVWGKTNIAAQGRITEKFQKIAFDRLLFSAGNSEMRGHLFMALTGERPLLEGEMKAVLVDPADYIVPVKNAEGALARLMQVALRHREGKTYYNIFSHTPFDLAWLQAFDMDLTLDFDRLYWGLASFDKMKARILMTEGQLFLSPFSAGLGGARLKGQTRLDARHDQLALRTLFYGKGIEFAKLFNISGMESLISGKVDMDFSFESEGRSLYELASKGKGEVNLLMDSGELSSSQLREIAGNVLDVFLPGARSVVSPGINCMAARYKIEDGLVKTQGFLLDMDTTTVLGTGQINLPDELINMSFFTRPKGVGMGAMLPPMHVYGPLFGPEVLFDTKGVMHKMAKYLSGQDESDGKVPSVLHIKGRNDCAVTLDNFALARAQTQQQSPVLSPSGTGGFLGGLQAWFGNVIEQLGLKIFGE